MKILYITKGDHVDYQNDCLLIGLKELFGSDVCDINKQEHNYVTYDAERASCLYGKGMSVTRILPDLEVDRTDITSKIKSCYYDLIVYGSIWRCHDYIEEILKFYPPNKVIAIDGEDEQIIHPSYQLGILYFKRELTQKHERLYPISFAIPTSKLKPNTTKSKDYSFITPLDHKTYIYDNEKDYYRDYSEARFGVTVKKAGWDCMRHYEILANGCIPHFLGLEGCPEFTMVHLPKKILLDVAQQIALQKDSLEHIYEMQIEKIMTHVKHNNTTLALAKYFMEITNDKI